MLYNKLASDFVVVLVGLEAGSGKSESVSHSANTAPVKREKRKEPIKVDINITVVPKTKKVSNG